MAVILVTYDLKQPGRDYKPLHDYLKTYTYCKDLESVWLLYTSAGTERIRDDLNRLIDSNDKTFVVRLQRDWNSRAFGCANWLNATDRNW